MPTVDPSQVADALGQKENHCPYGCALEDLDEYGYCAHLIGFTNDGVNVEPIRPLLRANAKGESYDTGQKQVVGGKAREKKQPGDKVINPEYVQHDKGVSHMAKRWVSARVYRETAEQREERLTKPEE